MTLERFRELKKEASLLKLKAMRTSALGGDPWLVLVAHHDAAARELRAAEEAIEDSSARDAQIEACGLFLEAKDWPTANKVWTTMVALPTDDIPEALRSLVASEGSRFSATWAEFSASLPHKNSFEGVRLNPIERVLEEYPGVAGFWWAKYRFHESKREWLLARQALNHAMDLAPENMRFVSMRMLLSVEIDSRASALAQSHRGWVLHRESSAEVNQIHALVLLKTTRSGGRDAVLGELEEATERAEGLARGSYLEAQASLLRAYVRTLTGEPPPLQLADYIERDRINEKKVLGACVPNWDTQVMVHLAA